MKLRNPVAKNSHKFNRSSVQEDKTKKSPEGDVLDGLEEHYIEVDERPSANTPEQIAWSEYKARCAAVIDPAKINAQVLNLHSPLLHLTGTPKQRADALLGMEVTEPGIVFDKPMTEDEAGVVIYDMQRMNLALQEPHITLPAGLTREERRSFIISKAEGMASLKESYLKAEQDGTLVKRSAKPD